MVRLSKSQDESEMTKSDSEGVKVSDVRDDVMGF